MKEDPKTLRRETLAAQGGGPASPPYREIVPPIHAATTYERGEDGSYPGGRVYSRADNPTYDAPEKLLASLEGGAQAMLFASGQAAAAAVFQCLLPGDTVLAPRDMYWALRSWLANFAAPRGLAIAFYQNDSIDDLAHRARETKPRLVWAETPANPTWDVTDIAAAADIARGAGAMLAVDSTSATPMLQRPLERGAHLVMHSATKYLNGHSDVIAGALVTAEDDAFWRLLRQARSGGGAVPGPFEAWLLLRGMRTLALRVAAASASAMAIATALEGHPKLSHVLYPGLASHPGHAVAARQMHGGFGGMLSVRLADGEQAARRFTNRLRLFRQATSLGSVESLAEHRASVEGPGTRCPADLVRLSVGIENTADLVLDLTEALA
jgi:cystathionine gamma-synthase